MATRLYFDPGPIAGTDYWNRGDNTAKLNGSNAGWQPEALNTSRAAGPADAHPTNTEAGPTSGVEATPTAGTPPAEFFSPPIDQDVTVSGTITLNIWAHESAMAANVAINVVIDRVDGTGAIISEVARSARTTELGTTNPPTSAANFTVSPTSTGFQKGDRVRARIFGDDASGVNMASGNTFTAWIGGATAAANGDSYIEFTETFGFITTAPAGSTLYLTDTAGPAVGSDIEKEMWTSRGNGVNSFVRATAAGWTSPLRWTDSSGGTAVEWYSRQLTAFTLSGLVLCNLRTKEDSDLDSHGNIRAELAVCNGDGSGATVWAATNFGTSNTEMGITEAAKSLYLCADDVAVTDGQRLRLRVYLDDRADIAMLSGNTYTLFYDGTSANATGDSWVQLTQTVTEYSPTPTSMIFAPAARKQHGALLSL